ncbi:DUF5946 family protein [Halosolutus gelatinilyticus]|uniref:DUF5946 family protein n=1 Tax=Halosolutus gelatinilyticus TaxID=2931975 RepID=UPI001FF32073|nr:DUF5946 family protein [Halosolutus gelatinilyticus]
MTSSDDVIECNGCEGLVPDGEYPGFRPDKNPGATSPGCWKMFCEEVLVREYSEWNYPPIHQLTVDTYWAQHPGEKTPQTTQSVIVNLVGLDLYLHKGMNPETVREKLDGLITRHKDEFTWLEPPETRGDITVVDVAEADDLDEHTALVRDWARAVWDAWKPHHPTLDQWIARALES